MKRILAAMLCIMLLVSSFAVTAFAAEDGADIQFSMKGGEGKAGDIVTVEVYMDKNPGTWACHFQVRFNERNFILLSVDNGDVFTDGEWVKSVLTNRGRYIYYAEGTSPTQNVTNTGLILTLTFEITERAPLGDNNITLFFPDNGYGWFFDATVFPDVITEYSVECTNSAVINVLNENGEAVTPDTDANGDTLEPDTDAADPETSDKNDAGDPDTDEDTTAPGTLVTDVVTDENGETEFVPVTDESGNEQFYVTDDEGNIVTNDSGNAEIVTRPPDTTAAPGIPVTEPVFDSDDNLVTDENGEKVTTQVVDPNGNLVYYVTDENGEVVTYPDGNDVLTMVPPEFFNPEPEDSTGEAETIAPETEGVKNPETEAPAPDTTTQAPETDAAREPVAPVSPYKIILIASLAAVVVGAIIVIIVMTKPKKEEK